MEYVFRGQGQGAKALDASNSGGKQEPIKVEALLERVFWSDDTLPDAKSAFLFAPPPLEAVVKNADIVLDANTLLVPYGAGSGSLKEVTKVLQRLGAEKRLFLPAQAAREYIRNRPTKLGDLQHQLSDKMGRYSAFERIVFPVLEDVPQFKALNDLISEAADMRKKLLKASGELVNAVKAWEWKDPVNEAYTSLFKSEMIVDPEIDRQACLTELQRRQRLKLPPGYKDASKDDLGIGDFLIWQTILQIGARNKKPLIFVSGDEKADWQHRSDERGFLPRYELLDEYRRSSGGRPFYLIPLSKLMELLQASDSTVAEIKKEEERIGEGVTAGVNCPVCNEGVSYRLGLQVGSTTRPLCMNCGEQFYVHRTRKGVLIKAIGDVESPAAERAELREFVEAEDDMLYEIKPETVACPECGDLVGAELSTEVNDTTWCRCENCTVRFPIHRRRDGGIRVSRARRLGTS